MSDFAPVFAGWNVWAVWQVKDLDDWNPAYWGLDRDRRLRLWVEDALRLGAAGATVADPLALKGSQIELLPGAPSELKTEARKEEVQGPAMLVDGPAELRYVRFFNRGQASKLVWPHDDNYLLEQVFTPNPKAPATSSPAPPTITSDISESAGEIATQALKGAPWLAAAVGVVGIGFLLWKLKK